MKLKLQLRTRVNRREQFETNDRVVSQTGVGGGRGFTMTSNTRIRDSRVGQHAHEREKSFIYVDFRSKQSSSKHRYAEIRPL